MIPSLQEVLPELESLDRLRVRSAALRDLGWKALRKEVKHKDWSHYAKTTRGTEYSTIQLALTQAHLEAKQKGTCRHPDPHNLKEQVRQYNQGTKRLLKQLAFETSNVKPTPKSKVSSEIPFLAAARSLLTLSLGPTFSPDSLELCYHLVRELYTPDPKTWTIGSARAGAPGFVSAFATAECARAIAQFATTLNNTSTFLRSLRAETLASSRAFPAEISRPLQTWLEAWQSLENLRQRVDTEITLASYQGRLALELNIDREKYNLPGALKDGISDVVNNFNEVIPRVTKLRTPQQKYDRHHLERLGHEVALRALRKGLDRSQRALNHARELETSIDKNNTNRAQKEITRLADLFKIAERRVRALLKPVAWFSASVLDRELVAHRAGEPWDPGELAFGALAYGHATGHWDDHRLPKACRALGESISSLGLFPESKGFHRKDFGYVLQIANSELARVFAELMKRVPRADIDLSWVEKLMVFFEEARAPFRGRPHATDGDLKVDEKRKGWHYERGQDRFADRWSTALATLALRALNDLLDDRINVAVYEQFEVVQPRDLKEGLNELLYGDYGMCHKQARRKEPIAITLLRMRAHLINVRLARSSNYHLLGDTECIHSIVLHGPSGTGKTTLIEALAKSSEVPLVRVSPSDLILRGAEGLEARTRAVFRALSFLTRSVVLLDEFDPVIKDRDKAPDALTHFSFLTPGLLPRLKALNQQAKQRSVAFALATNYVEDLDSAAIRTGRFDKKVGVYHLDLLSRAGCLWRAWAGSPQEVRGNDYQTDEFDDRFGEILTKTAHVPVSKLAEPGWLLAARDSSASHDAPSPIRYLAFGEKPDFPKPDRRRSGSKKSSELKVQEDKDLIWLESSDGWLEDEASERLPPYDR